MKLSIIIILLFFSQTISLQADEIDIDKQISRIKQVSDEEKCKLINMLKQQIAQIHANQQAKAVARYQEEILKE
jgi:hypothetical protein